jgi:hypothetical protein
MPELESEEEEMTAVVASTLPLILPPLLLLF